MADVTISELLSIEATGSTILPVSQGGATYQTTASSVVNTVGARTDSFKLPVGSTAQRPNSLTSGLIRYNTNTNSFEGYNGLSWSQFAQPFTASGGSISNVTIGGVNYRIHTYTSSSNFVVTGQGTVECMLVGGGGSGGRSRGGGGGGGSVVFSSFVLSTGTYYVSIGSGGAVPGAADKPGNNGESTSFNGIFALGGGGGGQALTEGKMGGNGGGAGGSGGSVGTGYSGGDGLTGYRGGSRTGAFTIGGGGGGAQGAGGSVTAQVISQGTGGSGYYTNFNGTDAYYGGGGGGGVNAGSYGAPGGAGGGGAGGGFAAYPATAGTSGLGGGGGGGGTNSSTEYEAGAGGSGLAIIRYRI